MKHHDGVVEYDSTDSNLHFKIQFRALGSGVKHPNESITTLYELRLPLRDRYRWNATTSFNNYHIQTSPSNTQWPVYLFKYPLNRSKRFRNRTGKASLDHF